MATHAYERRQVLLEMDRVTAGYGGPPVLRDLTVQIRDVVRPGMEQGQIVAMLGPSGIGKTTLFKVLAGLMKPTSGAVRVGPEGRAAAPGMVGVVAQNYILFDHRSVLGNLMIAAKQAGLSSRDARARSLEVLQRFGLEGSAEKFPQQLSGGQRQRVAIAQQLLCSEHYLVMDEPFSGLDVLALQRVQELLREVALKHEHVTLIVVTHDVTAAVAIADTIWLMGRDRDAEGNVIPGARVMEEIDLVERGLAWHDDVHDRPGFHELVDEIKERFHTL